jgi:hypothetical protein
MQHSNKIWEKSGSKMVVPEDNRTMGIRLVMEEFFISKSNFRRVRDCGYTSQLVDSDHGGLAAGEHRCFR